MNLDEFLGQQGVEADESRFTATVEAIPERPDDVKVTPYAPGHGCGCASALELPKRMIQAVTPTGEHHLCCGKRLEVVSIEFAEDAAIPVAELMRRALRPAAGPTAPMPAGGWFAPQPGRRSFAARRPGGGQGLVGRWPIPWTPCTVECIEVCTEFCSDTGWDCCKWETRCGIDCSGYAA